MPRVKFSLPHSPSLLSGSNFPVDTRSPTPMTESPPVADTAGAAADRRSHRMPHPGAHQLPGSLVLPWRRRMLALGGGAGELDWLLDLAGGLRRSELHRLHLHPDLVVDLRCRLGDLEVLWRRHLSSESPLQYLVGVCPWRDLLLRVTPSVLIPRPETELLVELALGLQRSTASPWPEVWADLGTGSGCLALALARAFPASQGLASDISGTALSVAADNLRQAGGQCRVELREGHWWKAVRSHWGRLSLVVANPPYIPTDQVMRLDPVVRLHEPLEALDGGPDGLREIRQVVAGASIGLAPHGLLLLEHHHDQSEAVRELLWSAGLVEIRTHRDLEGVARFASGRRPREQATA